MLNLKVKLFNSVEYDLHITEKDKVYLGTSLDILDTRDQACSLIKIPLSISNVDKILSLFKGPTPFICSKEESYLYEWASLRLQSPITPEITPFLDYLHPEDGDVIIKLDSATFSFELVKITTFVEVKFEDPRKIPMLDVTARNFSKLCKRHEEENTQEIGKHREGTFFK